MRAEQLDAALALEPDLVSLLAGLNDMLRKTVDLDAVVGEIDAMVEKLRDAGADVLLFTLPDPLPINPLAKAPAARLVRLNAAIHESASTIKRRGRPRRVPVSSDRGLWNEDRLHADAEGHGADCARGGARARCPTPTRRGARPPDALGTL